MWIIVCLVELFPLFVNVMFLFNGKYRVFKSLNTGIELYMRQAIVSLWFPNEHDVVGNPAFCFKIWVF